MDIVSLVELMAQLGPGTVMHAQYETAEKDKNPELNILSVNGLKIEEA